MVIRRCGAQRTVAVAVAATAVLAGCAADPAPSADPVPPTAGTTLVEPDDANAPIADAAVPTLGDRDLDVAHYDLELDYTPETGELDATATLELAVERPSDAVVLDLVDLEVSGVRVDGAEAPFEHADGKVTIDLGEVVAPGAPMQVAVDYAGVPDAVQTRALGGVEVGWQVRDDGSYVLSEPEGARTWYPVNDHPTDKATYDITVTVPEGVTAVANGELVDERADDTTTTTHWRMAEPMAPYLATVVTGDYVGTSNDADGDGVLPQNVWTAGDTDGAEDLLAAQGEAVDLLEGWLGPFPFSTYGGVVLPPDDTEPFFDNVAIETQSLSLYGAESVVGETVVHEAAHQWFGNSVSVTRWGDDIWWVEGFARYSEWLWIEDADGQAAYDRAVERTYDQLAEAERPVAPGDLSVSRLFSAWSYDRGGLTFAALRAEIGDEDFEAFLRTFVERYGGANATTEDLIATAEAVSDEDLEPFFDAWVFSDELPPAP